MAHHSEEETIPRAFEEALEATFSMVRDRLTRRFGDEQLAEEVSWDCVTQAYEAWRGDPTFFAERDLRAWTSQRALWRALDRLRERGRFVPLSEEHSSGNEGEAGGPAQLSVTDEETMRQWERDRQLTWNSLQQLPSADRELLEQYYYEERTDQEIGAQLYGEEGSEQARGLRVWRRRQKALTQLEKILIENGLDSADYAPLTHQAI